MRPLILSFMLVSLSSASYAGPNQQVWIKALETMDHVSREAYSAVFNRQKQLQTSVFKELRPFSQTASPWQNPAWSTQESTSFAPCGMELKMTQNSEWTYQKSACGSFPAAPFARMSLKGNRLSLELPLDAWKGRIDFGSASQNQTAKCDFDFKAESLESVKCQGLYFANNEGEELRITKLAYDQTSKNVVDIEGELLLAGGLSEKVLLTAPTRSSKMFVTLVRKEIVTEPIDQKQPVAKTEEEVLTDMKALAQNWEEWEEHTAVYGDPSVEGDVEAKEQEREEAYQHQDLASPEGELVEVEGQEYVGADDQGQAQHQYEAQYAQGSEAVEEEVGEIYEDQAYEDQFYEEEAYEEEQLPDLQATEQAAQAVRPVATRTWEHGPGR